MEAIIIAESFGGVFLATSLRNALVPEYMTFYGHKAPTSRNSVAPQVTYGNQNIVAQHFGKNLT
jgi:hypothetical protein